MSECDCICFPCLLCIGMFSICGHTWTHCLRLCMYCGCGASRKKKLNQDDMDFYGEQAEREMREHGQARRQSDGPHYRNPSDVEKGYGKQQPMVVPELPTGPLGIQPKDTRLPQETVPYDSARMHISTPRDPMSMPVPQRAQPAEPPAIYNHPYYTRKADDL